MNIRSLNVLQKVFPYVKVKKSSISFIFFLIAGISSAIQAQNPVPVPPISFDQFKKNIEEIESVDAKVDQYLQASIRFSAHIPDSVFKLAREVRQLEGLNDQEREAYYYFILANAWRTIDKDSVIYYAEEATTLLRNLGEHNSYLRMENLLGLELSRKRNFVKADSVFKNAISYGLTLEEVEYPVKYFYGNLGSLYTTVGAHDLAIQMYERFLEQEDTPGDRCNIISKLAVSLANLDEHQRAVDLLSPCLEFEQLPPPIKAIVRSNLSRMYDKLGNDELSIKLMEEAVKIATEYHIPNLQISNQIELGVKYLSAGYTDKAEKVRSNLEQIPDRLITPLLKIDKNRFIAEFEMAKGNSEQAIKYADAAIQSAETYNLLLHVGDVYITKAKAYEDLGFLDKALENERLNTKLELSRHNKEEEENLVMMRVRYQLESKEAALVSMSDELKTVKVRNALIILLIILIAVYVLYRYRIHYLFQEQLTRNRIARDLHDDLSGTLSSISFFTEAANRVYKLQEDAGKYLKMIDKSAIEAKEKINDIIWAIDPTHDDWPDFINKCKRFTADTLDSKSIEYEITMAEHFSKPLTLELRQNLWLIYKEIINNLVRHSKADFAKVEVYEKEKHIYFKIEDNGSGFDTGKESERYGIKNIKHRAGKIGASVILNSEPGNGTKWILEIG